jgi:hypothetical protein
MEAHISFMFSTIKSGFSNFSFVQNTIYAVLSLKKLKFKPGTLGLVNTNAFGFPIGHADLKGPPG